MPDIMVVLACLSQCVPPTPRRQLGRVIEALLSISGRITMKGLSRWSDKGGSYRTIQGCGSFETTHFDFFNSRLRYLQGRDTPHSGISGDARVPVVCETANILQSHRWSEANATLTPPPHFAGANVPRSGPCDL